MPFDTDGHQDGRDGVEPSASLTSVTIRKGRRGGARRPVVPGTNGAATQPPPPPPSPPTRSPAVAVAAAAGVGRAASSVPTTTAAPTPSPTASDSGTDDLSIPMPTPQPVRARPAGATGRAPFTARAYLPPRQPIPPAAAESPVATPSRSNGGPSSRFDDRSPPLHSPTAAVRVQPPGLLATRWSQARARLGRMPGMLFVDQNDIAGQWPNSLIMAIGAGRGRLTVTPVQRYLPTPGSGTMPVEFDTTVVQWVSDTAREAARLGKAVQDTEAVHTSEGWVRLGCLALPLTTDNRTLDRVLCHLYPA